MATETLPAMLSALKKDKAAKAPKAAPAPEYTPPTPAERTIESAHSAKVNATRDWIEGSISTKKHAQIHSRANKVLKATK